MGRFWRRVKDKDIGPINLAWLAGLSFLGALGLQVASWAGLVAVSPIVPWIFMGAGVVLGLADLAIDRKRRRRRWRRRR